MSNFKRPPAPPLPRGVKRRGDWADIPVPTSYEHEWKTAPQHRACFLGRGRYSLAFRLAGDGPVILYTYFGDMCKEILTGCQEGHDAGGEWVEARNPHIPEIEQIGTFDAPRYADDIRVYRARWYEPLTAAHKEAWAQRNELARVREEAYREHVAEAHMAAYEGVTVNYQTAETARVPASLKASLMQLTNEAANYGSGYMFDNFRKGNQGVDEEGRLVLLDPMFDAEETYKEYLALMRRGQSRATWA
jgi:hypothetical protein